MLSKTLGLNFCCLKIMHILQANTIGHILENKQKNKCGWIHEIIRLIIMKMKMKMKNRSHRSEINRLRSRHGHISGLFLAVRATIAHNHLRPFSKYFQILYIFVQIVKYFAPFLPFFWNIARMPLVSRVGPVNIVNIRSISVWWWSNTIETKVTGNDNVIIEKSNDFEKQQNYMPTRVNLGGIYLLKILSVEAPD